MKESLKHSADLTSIENSSSLSKIRNWGKKRKMGIAVGMSAASLAAGAALSPAGKTIDRIEKGAPWVIPVEGGLDAAIGLGVVAMLAAGTGDIIKNPYKAKHYIKDLPQNANDSNLFKTGFAVSTAAGIAWGGVAISSIISYLPPEAWGSLALPSIDLALTLGTRKAIWDGMQAARVHEAGALIES